eukprot:6186030-Pleurochrysis_carterae.AAC.1
MVGGRAGGTCPARGRGAAVAIGLALQGGEPERTPLEAALSGLGLAWATLDGTAAEGAQGAAANRALAAEMDELWLVGGCAQPATWRRLAPLRALGVLIGVDQPATTGRTADFLAGVVDAAAEAGHVALALRAAVQEAERAREGAMVAVGEAGQHGLAATGHACAAAIRAVLDALGPEGEAEVAAGAYRPARHLGR